MVRFDRGTLIKLKTIGLGDMLMLWDGNVMYVLFEAGSEAVLSSE